jgi:hypothetical protein
VLVFVASHFGARAEESAITGLRIVSETSKTLTVEVQYLYSGEHGPEVFASAIMANGSEASTYYAYRPASVQRGNGRSQVELSANASAPEIFVTNSLIAKLYVGGKSAFAQQVFAFPKTWVSAGHIIEPRSLSRVAAVPDALKTKDKLKPTQGDQIAQPSAESDVQRRVLSDGTVELRREDGTVVQRTKSSQTIIHPDGTSSTMMYANAQPPSPPSGAPDDVLSAWLNSECDKLLDLMRTLTRNDSESIANYLQREGPTASTYLKIRSRIDVISLMIAPVS